MAAGEQAATTGAATIGAATIGAAAIGTATAPTRSDTAGTATGRHTVVVRMSTDPRRTAEVVEHLRRDVVGWASRQPGFVSGRWLCAPGGEQGMGVVEFDSRVAAEAAARGPRSAQPDASRAWNVERVDVFEEVARARRDG